MIRLLLVEDEPIERQGIRLMLENSCPNLAPICEAANGIQALELCRGYRPHLAMVDIHMPGLTGLETIRALQEIDPAIRFIILTSHDRFEYAHEAITLGVEDYILKPARIARLKEAVDKVIHKLEHTAAEKNQQTALLERMNRIRPILERDCVYELISGEENPRPCDFGFLDFEVCGGFCFVLEGRGLPPDLPQRVRQAFQALGPYCIGEEANGQLVFFVLYSQRGVEARPGTLVRYVLDSLGLSPGDPALEVGVSAFCRDAQSLSGAYSQALRAMTGTHAGVAALGAGAEEAPGPARPSREHMPGPARHSWQGEVSPHTLAGRVLEYIQANYRKNLSLDSLGERFGVTPYYLSRLIKSKAGQSFPDLLAQRRIQEAKRLLQQGASIKAVTYEVGFRSQNYFGKIFKKHTGLTPTEYRSRHGGGSPGEP